MNEKKSEFTLELKVRDYEVDLQGIVNNAVYQHYLEHARHEFLLSRAIDFAALHERGSDLIITRVEIDYKCPLKSRDHFQVNSRIRRDGRLKVIFEQQIVRQPDNKMIVQARVTGVCLKGGKPVRPEDVLDIGQLGLE